MTLGKLCYPTELGRFPCWNCETTGTVCIDGDNPPERRRSPRNRQPTGNTSERTPMTSRSRSRSPVRGEPCANCQDYNRTCDRAEPCSSCISNQQQNACFASYRDRGYRQNAEDGFQSDDENPTPSGIWEDNFQRILQRAMNDVAPDQGTFPAPDPQAQHPGVDFDPFRNPDQASGGEPSYGESYPEGTVNPNALHDMAMPIRLAQDLGEPNEVDLRPHEELNNAQVAWPEAWPSSALPNLIPLFNRPYFISANGGSITNEYQDITAGVFDTWNSPTDPGQPVAGLSAPNEPLPAMVLLTFDRSGCLAGPAVPNPMPNCPQMRSWIADRSGFDGFGQHNLCMGTSNAFNISRDDFFQTDLCNGPYAKACDNTEHLVPWCICTTCHETQNARYKDDQNRAVEATKAYLCMRCAEKARNQGIVKDGACICTRTLRQAWLCHDHREAGIRDLEYLVGVVDEWRLRTYESNLHCAGCWENVGDTNSGTWGCKVCREWVAQGNL